MSDDQQTDFALLIDSIRDWARTEERRRCEQTRKNLEREIAEWKARYAKVGQRLGRSREIGRILRKHARADALTAVLEFNRKQGESMVSDAEETRRLDVTQEQAGSSPVEHITTHKEIA